MFVGDVSLIVWDAHVTFASIGTIHWSQISILSGRAS